MVGTEMVYYAVGELGLEGGICVTASHNPKQYTGMKIVRRGALPVGGDSGLEDVRAGAQAGFRRRAAPRRDHAARTCGRGFVDKVLVVRRRRRRSRSLRIVVDAANGMAGAMLPPCSSACPQLEVVRCYFDPDGTFPNHEPNPLLPENREFIVAKTREEGAVLGVAYTATRTAAASSTTPGRFAPGTSSTAPCTGDAREEPGRRLSTT